MIGDPGCVAARPSGKNALLSSNDRLSHVWVGNLDAAVCMAKAQGESQPGSTYSVFTCFELLILQFNALLFHEQLHVFPDEFLG